MIWLFVLVLMFAIEAPGWLWFLWLACVAIKWVVTFRWE